MSKVEYDKFEITDATHIQNFFMGAIQAGKIPTAETIMETGIDELSRLVPARKGQSFEKIESVSLIHDIGAPSSALPVIIDVAYSYVKPKDIPLAFPVSRQIADRWDTARVGTLLEQILDQLKIGNTSSLRTDVLEPISKLAINGITADSKELADLRMEVSSLKSANAIYEVENGRLMAAISEERNKLELELRKERAKAKSHRESTWIPQSNCAEDAYKKVEEHDRYMARSILISARALYVAACHSLLEVPDYMLRFSHFKQRPVYVVNYIHAMADALAHGLDQKKVTLQMVKEAKNIALQCDKHATMAVDEELGLDHTINWNDIHPDMYEPYYIKLRAIYTTPSPENKDQ
ncbi:hypothetical protein JT351_gp49 [Providencia phage vB_PreS-PibeRecoleta]|uniref:Uncharacterized protein n=1 Tax=Providencia phage vB_PreS-PibeRecoleta TaxID=2761109 RepID=A0A7G5B0Y2_9CAUD|nr:hypothetical protein JT351_gp49 [Providencia phage vB_PreS-PibeRecoleta]QMV29955.1 hypothetical protein [Providencia phage vB_PreS-PibeRecoleta]